MKYVSMIHFKDDEFQVTTATTIEETEKILSAGFNYVTQKDSIMLFRRPKRFRCKKHYHNRRSTYNKLKIIE